MPGIFSGPWNVARKCVSLYDCFGVDVEVNEYGAESHAEVPRFIPSAYVYSERPVRRLFPNAAGCANGDAAPLLTLPLTSRPSAAALDASDAGGGGSAGVGAAAAARAGASGRAAGVTSVRW